MLRRTFGLTLLLTRAVFTTSERFGVPAALRVRGGFSLPLTRGYRAVQVQVVLRHGDRTPITKLKDESFWASTVIPPKMLEKIGQGTSLIRAEKNEHKAAGVGAFGQLTQLGLMQLVEVGAKIREDLVSPTEKVNDQPGALWTAANPPTAKDIHVISTDFPRTIQSVQGFLVGLFPDQQHDEIVIDCRHTRSLIPDPQPRNSKEQEDLEKELSQRPDLVAKEAEMYPLAKRLTNALRPLLAEEAFDMSFGLAESSKNVESKEERVLPWVQLLEVCKCLKIRNLLPDSITEEDMRVLSEHTTGRWFEMQKNQRLTYLAMNKFTKFITDKMKQPQEECPLTVYSCHDSSLIGLISAFQLEQPAEWPEYASYLKIELLEVEGTDEKPVDHVVRFSLCGKPLRCSILGEPREVVPLQLLCDALRKQGKDCK